MRLTSLMVAAASMGLTVPAWAKDYCFTGPKGNTICIDITRAPEIGSTGSLAALVVVAAFAAILWERSRRRAS